MVLKLGIINGQNHYLDLIIGIIVITYVCYVINQIPYLYIWLVQFRDWIIDYVNWFELIIILGSGVCLFPSPKASTKILAGKMFDIVRIFRVIRYIPSLHTLANTILVSLPSLIYVIELLGISIFEFAIMFANSFENMAAGNGIGNDINFQSFSYSFVTIFQVSKIIIIINK